MQIRATTLAICVVVSLAFLSVKADFHNLGPGFYGPYDYTNPTHVREKLPVVEEYHFNSDIENLTGTMPGGTMGAHLWYVIRSFPNHHRALNSMGKLWRRHRREGTIPEGIDPGKTPEYLFDRAMRFSPQDAGVRLIYGIHLHKLGNLDEALKLYQEAAQIQPNLAEAHYNMGLLYMEKRNYVLANEYAHKAYQLGFPLPGLRNKLIAVGAWKGTMKH
jgi:tetratricopeptide (TPR) repeat protein